MLVAAGARESAQAFSASVGAEVVELFDRYEIARDPRGFVRSAHGPDIERLVIHSADWQREVVPQIYLMALATTRKRERWIADDRRKTVTRIPAGRAVIASFSSVAGVPWQMLRGVSQLREFLRRSADAGESGRALGDGRRILTIWSGDPTVAVGGSVSHTSGILRGFRNSGWQTIVVCGVTPPAQIRAAADEVVVADPVRPAARLTPELASLASNQTLYESVMEAARAFGRPDLVYQRHAAFRTVGVDAARQLDTPLVLEWNASEAWAFENWSHEAKPVRASTARLMRTVERATVAAADLVAPVSTEAGRMATAAGANPGQVLVSPNAVAIDEIDSAVAGVEPSGEPLVGWIGSFGEWHGAEVLIRAFALLPSRARLRLIGDGRGRRDCERLAQNLDVFDRIEWCGRTDRPLALAKLAECRVLACPTVELAGGAPFFGSPTKLFEYMALRRPVVASKLGQIEEVLADGDTGLLTPPGDHARLAEAIERLLEDAAAADDLARAARTEVETNHRWEQRARAIVAALGAR